MTIVRNVIIGYMQTTINEEIKLLVMSNNKEDVELAVSLLYNIDRGLFKKDGHSCPTTAYKALGGTGNNLGDWRMEIIADHIKKMEYLHDE